MKRVTIRRSTIIAGSILIALTLIAFVFGGWRIERVIMGGPIQRESQETADLIADILPPPLYVIEPYLVAHQLHREPARRAELERRLGTLRTAYAARETYWQNSAVGGGLKAAVTGEVRESAARFWAELDTDFLPAIRSAPPAAIEASFDRLTAAYDGHRAAVDRTVARASAYQLELRADSARQIDTTHRQLLVLAALVALGLGGFVALILRRVLRPMRSITAAMTAMAQGNAADADAEAERPDEIGDIARALGGIITHTAERARQDTETQAALQGQVVAALGTGLGALRDGELRHRIGRDFPGEYAQLRDDYNAAADAMEAAIAAVRDTSLVLNNGANEIAEATADLSTRTEQQAARVEETSAAMTSLTDRVKQASGASHHAAGLMTETDRQAADNARILEDAIAAMARVQEAAGKIDQIVGLIDGLAFQTNMLALNASIEAARAGAAGKGFDVVANAVRALAERSAEAARTIRSLTDRSSAEVRVGTDLVVRSGGAMKDIIAKVADGSALVSEIASTAADQTAGIVQVQEAIASIDDMTQKNAAMGEQCNAAARLLRAEADRLQALVNRFETRAAA